MATEIRLLKHNCRYSMTSNHENWLILAIFRAVEKGCHLGDFNQHLADRMGVVAKVA